jgi:hypothetical protein
MVEEEENYYVESVGGIDKDTPSTSLVHMLSTPIHMPSSFISNVESVHVQAFNVLDVNVSQLVTIETQVVA